MWKYMLQVVIIWNACVMIITQEDNPHDGKTFMHEIFPMFWYAKDMKHK